MANFKRPTTVDLINNGKYPNAAAGTIIETLGYTTKGDGGGAQWKKTGVTGLTASQSPADLVDGKLTDANGHEWEIVSDGFLSVKKLGAAGDGVADDTPAIQATIDKVHATGGSVFFPQGAYRTTAELLLDMQGITGAPNTNQRRVNFIGEGKGNTVIKPNADSINTLKIVGDNPLTSASHAYLTIRDIAFGGNSPTARTANGLVLQDVAYLTVEECSFHNLNACVNLIGCLSSGFSGDIFNESTKGVITSVSASGPHSNTFSNCEFRQLTTLAFDSSTSIVGTSFYNCRFEACGTAADNATGAVKMIMSGSAGETGPLFSGCYIEGNRGGFDISLTESASVRISCTFVNTCFNRVNVTNHVVNNIVAAGDVDLNLVGCSFTSFNTYVPDVSRKYLNIGSTVRVRDLGNRYSDPVEAPVTNQGIPYTGFVNGSLGASVTATLPNNWSVAYVSPGLYTITHNLGHTDYAVVATVNSVNARNVQRCVKNANSFQIRVVNTADVGTDDDAGFMLIELKPIK